MDPIWASFCLEIATIVQKATLSNIHSLTHSLQIGKLYVCNYFTHLPSGESFHDNLFIQFSVADHDMEDAVHFFRIYLFKHPSTTLGFSFILFVTFDLFIYLFLRVGSTWRNG